MENLTMVPSIGDDDIIGGDAPFTTLDPITYVSARYELVLHNCSNNITVTSMSYKCTLSYRKDGILYSKVENAYITNDTTSAICGINNVDPDINTLTLSIARDANDIPIIGTTNIGRQLPIFLMIQNDLRAFNPTFTLNAPAPGSGKITYIHIFICDNGVFYRASWNANLDDNAIYQVYFDNISYGIKGNTDTETVSLNKMKFSNLTQYSSLRLGFYGDTLDKLYIENPTNTANYAYQDVTIFGFTTTNKPALKCSNGVIGFKKETNSRFTTGCNIQFNVKTISESSDNITLLDTRYDSLGRNLLSFDWVEKNTTTDVGTFSLKFNTGELRTYAEPINNGLITDTETGFTEPMSGVLGQDHLYSDCSIVLTMASNLDNYLSKCDLNLFGALSKNNTFNSLSDTNTLTMSNISFDSYKIGRVTGSIYSYINGVETKLPNNKLYNSVWTKTGYEYLDKLYIMTTVYGTDSIVTKYPQDGVISTTSETTYKKILCGLNSNNGCDFNPSYISESDIIDFRETAANGGTPIKNVVGIFFDTTADNLFMLSINDLNELTRVDTLNHGNTEYLSEIGLVFVYYKSGYPVELIVDDNDNKRRGFKKLTLHYKETATDTDVKTLIYTGYNESQNMKENAYITKIEYEKGEYHNFDDLQINNSKKDNLNDIGHTVTGNTTIKLSIKTQEYKISSNENIELTIKPKVTEGETAQTDMKFIFPKFIKKS